MKGESVMGHNKKKHDEYRHEINNGDLKSYENKLEGLKRSVKELEKINKRKKEITKLEKKRKKILRDMKNGHK
jgi:predicted RNase H-like nuclease (RuvC/YqgF family)